MLYSYVEATVHKSCDVCLWCDATVVRQAVRNLQLSAETTESLEASWEMNDPYVENYRISYFGDNHKEETVSSFLLITLVSVYTPKSLHKDACYITLLEQVQKSVLGHLLYLKKVITL